MWVSLITHSRIISNQQYIPCSLYQMCLVCDNRCVANKTSCFSIGTFSIFHTSQHMLHCPCHQVIKLLHMAQWIFTHYLQTIHHRPWSVSEDPSVFVNLTVTVSEKIVSSSLLFHFFVLCGAGAQKLRLLVVTPYWTVSWCDWYDVDHNCIPHCPSSHPVIHQLQTLS